MASLGHKELSYYIRLSYIGTQLYDTNTTLQHHTTLINTLWTSDFILHHNIWSSWVQVDGWKSNKQQAITWTMADLLSIGPSAMTISKIWNKI